MISVEITGEGQLKVLAGRNSDLSGWWIDYSIEHGQGSLMLLLVAYVDVGVEIFLGHQFLVLEPYKILVNGKVHLQVVGIATLNSWISLDLNFR